jgi:YggT family protein
VLAQIAVFLIDTVVTLLVVLLLLRFHFQWLRVPFRNPIGEFVLATTSWAVVPARRVIPSLAGLDLATLLVAWLVLGLGLWLLALLGAERTLGGDPGALAVAAVAAVDLLRYSVFILVFAVLGLVVFSWVNPRAPLAPVFYAFTRPFLQPFQRIVPPIGGVDLSPLVLGIVVYIALIVIAYLRATAATL